MENPILGVIQQALLLLSKALPKDIQPLVSWVAQLVGSLKLPATDPRVTKVAAMTEQLLVDIAELQGMKDGSARDMARLIIENRFGRAWIEAGLSGGGV